jgi:sulfur relay protein TusB/DsrH
MLYILKGPSGKAGIDLALMDKDAKVVLIEDGVYLDTGPLKGKAKLYALEKDVEKRGLSDKLVGVELIDYEGLVDLIERDRVANF